MRERLCTAVEERNARQIKSSKRKYWRWTVWMNSARREITLQHERVQLLKFEYGNETLNVLNCCLFFAWCEHASRKRPRNPRNQHPFSFFFFYLFIWFFLLNFVIQTVSFTWFDHITSCYTSSAFVDVPISSKKVWKIQWIYEKMQTANMLFVNSKIISRRFDKLIEFFTLFCLK